MGNGPVERREDYRHIKATASTLTGTAAIFTVIGGAAMWLGAQIISPGSSIRAVKTEVQAVRDTMVVRTDALRIQQMKVSEDHHRLGRNVQFLIAMKCQEVDAQTRQTIAALGLSCREVMQELQQNGQP